MPGFFVGDCPLWRGVRRAFEQRVIERFLECGDPHHGFAHLLRRLCGYDAYVVML